MCAMRVHAWGYSRYGFFLGKHKQRVFNRGVRLVIYKEGFCSENRVSFQRIRGRL